MKKLFLVLVMSFLIPTLALAVQWHKADSKTVSWDATTTFYDNEVPLPSDMQGLKFYIYIKNRVVFIRKKIMGV